MNDSYILLKFGTLKGWHFSEEFCKNHKEQVEMINSFYDDELYKNHSCVFTASEEIKHREDLKKKLCDILDIFFDLGCKIENNFDNKPYKTKDKYRRYILNYGKED